MVGTVRAKFRFNGYEAAQVQQARKDAEGKPVKNDIGAQYYDIVELRTLKFSPVYGNGDPNHENTKFWDASPSGEIRLGTVNPNAWEAFKLGHEYYIDFTPAAD